MKLHELINELTALATAGLRNAEVEVAVMGRRGVIYTKAVLSAERSADRTPLPTVRIRAIGHREQFEVE